MAHDQIIVECKRFGTDLRDFKALMRKTYPQPGQQVSSVDLKQKAATLAEVWIGDLSQRPEIATCVTTKFLADLSVHFQRILLFAEKATIRRRYDEELGSVLKDYTANLVVPLMQGGGRANADASKAVGNLPAANQVDAEGFQATAFVGHSFAAKDAEVANAVTKALEAIGVRTVTGEKPKADRISDKVKQLIDGQHIFVGIFTRRDRLVGKKEWSTSAWVIDEKAYASRTKKLILLKENGVESIGGIQGDYEFIEFDRDKLAHAIVGVLQLFKLTVEGLR
ncbi:MAG: hypothetical protein ABSD98_17075 [Candidatus Korobacteraceae bacterium]|jgi:hypothetical protein